MDVDIPVPGDPLERHQDLKEIRSAVIRPERKYLTDFQNPIEFLTDDLFVERYGLTKTGVIKFMECIVQDLSNSSNRGQPLPPLLKFLVVLRFYAAGSFQEVAGELEHVSQPTVSRLVKNVSDVIARKKGKFISYPVGKTAETEMTSFYEQSGFPDVVGIIGCTHIKIQSPGGVTAKIFKNKDGYSSLNIQATCNSNMQFTNIVARWGGSVPNSIIFEKSMLREKYENGIYEGTLLGDNEYGCCEYLMTPIQTPQNSSEKRYNSALMSARIYIPKTFLLWKKVFPCLSSGFRIHVSTTMAVIVATAVLYNFGRQNRYYIYRKWQYLKSINVPHDPPSVLKMGHFTQLFGNDEKCFQYDNEMKKKHGPIWGAYRMIAPTITVHDPSLLRQIFNKEFPAFSVRQRGLSKLFGKYLNNGLTSVEGQQWKRIRSSMTPTFSASKIRQMMYILERCINNATQALDRKLETDQGVFRCKTLFSRLSLDVVCSAAFSVEVNSQDDSVKEPEISMHAKKLFSLSILNPLLLMCVICPPFERVVEYFDWSIFGKAQLNFFERLANTVIKQRESSHNVENERVDLMHLMLGSEISENDAKCNKSERGMDRTEIIGNSMLMILAGFENTGNTMTFLAYNLAQNMDVQKQVQKEVDDVLEKHGSINYDSVNDLKFLEMCINETLRLQTPILRNTRICDKETTINGFTIPKGITVHIPTFALAHDPDYWDEPYQFKPERMRDMSQIDPMMFQPFGAGPRNCIGVRFAAVEIKMSMAKMLRSFTILTSEDTPVGVAYYSVYHHRSLTDFRYQEPPLKLLSSLSVRPVEDFNLRVEKRG